MKYVSLIDGRTNGKMQNWQLVKNNFFFLTQKQVEPLEYLALLNVWNKYGGN